MAGSTRGRFRRRVLRAVGRVAIVVAAGGLALAPSPSPPPGLPSASVLPFVPAPFDAARPAPGGPPLAAGVHAGVAGRRPASASTEGASRTGGASSTGDTSSTAAGSSPGDTSSTAAGSSPGDIGAGSSTAAGSSAGSGPTPGAGVPDSCRASGWVAAWGSAPAASSRALGGRTLRVIVRPTLSGSALRVRLSGAVDGPPLQVGSVVVAQRDKGAAVRPDTSSTVTFGGRPDVTVPAGATVVSDPVPRAVVTGVDLAVSIALPAGAVVSVHPMGLVTSYVSDRGDHAGDQAGSAFRPTTQVPLLSGLDVRADTPAGAVVTLGDSLTDGLGTSVDGYQRWPDLLAAGRRARPGPPLAVVNAGISGNNVLAAVRGDGASALQRLDADVLSRAGVTDVVVLLGVNDLGQPGRSATAAQVQDGLRVLVGRLHAAGLRVITMTLPPTGDDVVRVPYGSYSSTAVRAHRHALNAWLRSGALRVDGFVDADALLRDPTYPDRLLPAYDAGDHLHLTPAAQQVLAQAVDGAVVGCP